MRGIEEPTKEASNPIEEKTPKSSPFAHGFGRGIKGKRTTRCSCTSQEKSRIGSKIDGLM
jgi:hypothetical protein